MLHYRIDSGGLDVESFVVICAGDENPYHKPDPRVFDCAMGELERRGITRAQVLYVGDDTTDLIAARDAGLQFVGVLTGFRTADNFVAAGLEAQHVIPSVAELPAYLHNREMP